MFKPNFTITPEIASALMRIEALKQEIKLLPITPQVLATLRVPPRFLLHYVRLLVLKQHIILQK